MDKCTGKLSLCQPASYQIEVVGHLDVNKATWFEGLILANEFGEDGTPITIMTGEVQDQAALHGLLTVIRDLGLPLLSVDRIESVQEDVLDAS
jgi:hypothetical protein